MFHGGAFSVGRRKTVKGTRSGCKTRRVGRGGHRTDDRTRTAEGQHKVRGVEEAGRKEFPAGMASATARPKEYVSDRQKTQGEFE